MDNYDYSKYNTNIKNAFEEVINRKHSLEPLITRSKHMQKMKIKDLISSKLDTIISKLIRIAKTHQEIMGYRYYWLSKKTFAYGNNRISINSLEHKNKITRTVEHFFSKNELFIRLMLRNYDSKNTLKIKQIKYTNDKNELDIRLNMMTEKDTISKSLKVIKLETLPTFNINIQQNTNKKETESVQNIMNIKNIKKKCGRPRKMLNITQVIAQITVSNENIDDEISFGLFDEKKYRQSFNVLDDVAQFCSN